MRVPGSAIKFPDVWLLSFALVLFIALPQAFAEQLEAGKLKGALSDAATNVPIEGARVSVLGTSHETITDANGEWQFELPDGVYELEIRATVFGEEHISRMVNQRVPQYLYSRAYVYTTAFLDHGYEPADEPVGLPSTSGALPEDSPDSYDLRDLWPEISFPGFGYYTIPHSLPPIIRVGRRQSGTGGCRDNPIVAIEEMDLDEYTKGVVPPEIGVFRNISGSGEVFKAFAIAAKSYGLWFILHYHEGNRRTVSSPKPPHNYTWFHIDDTACNQRYSDQRMSEVNAASNAVATYVMAKRGEPYRIDKYEYAASCGKHGTRPFYQTELVPDNPPTSACAGSWCGHNSCAAHQDNPSLPEGNRCLVRGICQWGSASWGENGKDYLWLLEHYQPNVELRQLLGASDEPISVALTGYVYTDPNNLTGSGVSEATVQLSDGQSTITTSQGLFYFEAVDVDQGSVTISASKSGYEPAQRTKQLEPYVTNWASIQISDDPNYVGPAPDPDRDSGVEDDTSTSEPSQGNNGSQSPDEPSPGQPGHESPHPSPGMDNATRQGLGPLVTPSQGTPVESTCSLGGNSHAPSMPLWPLAVALGIIGRKRLRSTKY